MAHRVEGDQKDGLLAQLFEIERQVRQAHGYPFDPGGLKRHLQDGIIGSFKTQTPGGIIPAESFLYDRRNDGLTLVEDVPRRITSVRDLELVPFLKKDENSVNGEEMVSRARIELDTNYGQHDAEWVFAHQHEIPVEFRKFYLVFTGTVWRGAGGSRIVVYLHRDGERWILNFDWLRDDFDSGDRLVRPRK
ncbi:MAG: hypothetical protein HY433_03870 [Candidatus Liptonbacteria bacterium]|nr:hypothetical protein [Candidatus Liptonbacteria bacterium]